MESIEGHVVRSDQPLAIELASTIHVADGSVVDALSTTSQLRTWLAINDERLSRPRPLAAGQLLPDLRALRDALRRLFAAAIDHRRPLVADIASVNKATGCAPDHIELRWTSQHGPHGAHVGHADPGRAVLARIAADGIEVLTGAYGPLTACGGPSCVLFFVPAHPRQAWCSPGCGNRARVARHYQRSRVDHGADRSGRRSRQR
ncbi:MAG: CGNR zinc finger domain-containing protein [Ilumatobacteraceae bacterium]